MKKTILGFAAIAALLLAGCAKNEVTHVNLPSAHAIKLVPSTSRASTATISTMQDDANGFKVYGTTATSAAADAWYVDVDGKAIDGTNNHVHSGGRWNFAAPVKVPTALADYPMNFYAWFPVAPAGIGTVTATPAVTPVIHFVYTVQPTAATQVDLLSGKGTATIKPASGHLSITFDHILSKVNFGIIANENYTSHVQALGIVNVANTGIYDVVAQGAWGGGSLTDRSHSFDYYNDFNGTAPAVPVPVKTFPGVAGNRPGNAAGVAAPFYTAVTTPTAADAHLRLMPQDPTINNWDPADVANAVANIASRTYIRMIYRCESTTPANPNFIGYLKASFHPAYSGSATEAAGYVGPLFVKVGYPYASVWIKGYEYTYNIELPGKTGGYLIDQRYYDENGNQTDLNVGAKDSGKQTNLNVATRGPGNDQLYIRVPDPILPSDDYIHLAPIVTPWADPSPSVMQ